MPAKTKSQHTCLPNHPGPLNNRRGGSSHSDGGEDNHNFYQASAPCMPGTMANPQSLSPHLARITSLGGAFALWKWVRKSLSSSLSFIIITIEILRVRALESLILISVTLDFPRLCVHNRLGLDLPVGSPRNTFLSEKESGFYLLDLILYPNFKSQVPTLLKNYTDKSQRQGHPPSLG